MLAQLVSGRLPRPHLRPGGRERRTATTSQLILYGGTLSATQVINSGFQCTQQASSSSYTSIIADLVFPGETVGTTSEYPAANGSTNGVATIFHDAANQLIFRSYSDWTWDVHAAVKRNSSVRMWQFGGFTPSWAYIPTIDYTSTGNWNHFHHLHAHVQARATTRNQEAKSRRPQRCWPMATSCSWGARTANASHLHVTDVYLSSEQRTDLDAGRPNNAPWTGSVRHEHRRHAGVERRRHRRRPGQSQLR